MNSLSDILGNKDFDIPPEVASIKKFMQDTFKATVSVIVRERDFVIIVDSAALAGSLRMKLPELRRRCQIEKRVIIRIGG